MTEKDLISYNIVLNSPVDEAMMTAIVNETIIDKNEPEADILTNTISTLMIDSSDHTERQLIMMPLQTTLKSRRPKSPRRNQAGHSKEGRP
jgi:hypothetical protein